MAKKRKKGKQKKREASSAPSPVVTRRDTGTQNSEYAQGGKDTSPAYPFYRSSKFWTITIASLSLFVAIAVPLYLTHRAEKKSISKLNHQLIAAGMGSRLDIGHFGLTSG